MGEIRSRAQRAVHRQRRLYRFQHEYVDRRRQRSRFLQSDSALRSAVSRQDPVVRERPGSAGWEYVRGAATHQFRRSTDALLLVRRVVSGGNAMQAISPNEPATRSCGAHGRRIAVSSILLRTAPVLAALWSMTPAGPAAAILGTVSADYSVASPDNTTLHIHNTSASQWTNVVLSGVGIIGGTASGVTGSMNIGTINATSTLDIPFGDFCPSVFAFDFDDCSQGEVNYMLQGTAAGFVFSANFSPSVNASGFFVGFLGNDANGFESDLTVVDTVVANIFLCGDGVVDPGEQCDDANHVNGDRKSTRLNSS